MWVDSRGVNFTTEQVVDFLFRSIGYSGTSSDLCKAYRVGRIYSNGGIWFQRLS